MLATLLFTDIVGSTAKAAESATAAGATCSPSTIASCARSCALSRARGRHGRRRRLRDLRRPGPRGPLRLGDRGRPSAALGLEIRAGVHTGEVEQADGERARHRRRHRRADRRGRPARARCSSPARSRTSSPARASPSRSAASRAGGRAGHLAPVRGRAVIAPSDGVASCAIHTSGRKQVAMKRSPVLRLDMRRVLSTSRCLPADRLMASDGLRHHPGVEPKRQM